MQEPPKGLGALYFRILQIMKQTMKVILNSNELGLKILICNVTTRWYILFYHLSNCILLE